jgi:preprotein translocase subunit SecY
MNALFRKLHTIFTDRSILKRILFVLGALVVFRLLAAIPIPGVDTAALANFISSNQFFGIFDIFSGGGLSNLSIMMLGVGPYITASIIMQLLTIMVPRLKALYHEEGEAGKKKFAQYSRLLTIPLAAIQGFSLLLILTRQGVLPQLGLFDTILNLVVVVAGSVLLMWIGELISEFGIGNGVSILIFAGIVSRLPSVVGQNVFSFTPDQIFIYAGFVIVSILVIAGIVFVTEAERPIPVTYARQVRGAKTYGGEQTYIPLRMNQAGVMPIIFALSILMFPQLVGSVLQNSANPKVAEIATQLASWSHTSLLYGVLYFLFVFLFTYFYTAVTFDPESMSNNLQKSGAFIPGIRPGKATEDYVGTVLTRITTVGGLFLATIAVLPIIMQSITGVATLAMGGTAVLIVVNVIIDILKKVDAQVTMREY